MRNFIWSDLHIFHANIIKYCNRPFATVEEMDKKIIENWKATVKNDDVLWNLGDVACHMNKEQLTTLIHSLPGYKILILGNHDHHNINRWRDIGFDEVYPYPIIYKSWFILSHDIVFLNEKLPYVNIHGHTHNRSMQEKSYVNVSVEVINYCPVDLDEIIKSKITLDTENEK